MGIPLRTLDQVKFTLERAKRELATSPADLAHLILRHGRLTDEARAWLTLEYQQ
jgi:hypothetical protein